MRKIVVIKAFGFIFRDLRVLCRKVEGVEELTKNPA
jgi:hypothetical protein